METRKNHYIAYGAIKAAHKAGARGEWEEALPRISPLVEKLAREYAAKTHDPDFFVEDLKMAGFTAVFKFLVSGKRLIASYLHSNILGSMDTVLQEIVAEHEKEGNSVPLNKNSPEPPLQEQRLREKGMWDSLKLHFDDKRIQILQLRAAGWSLEEIGQSRRVFPSGSVSRQRVGKIVGTGMPKGDKKKLIQALELPANYNL